jgi:hypothetical protein
MSRGGVDVGVVICGGGGLVWVREVWVTSHVMDHHCFIRHAAACVWRKAKGY